jgi:hypothetical protein
MCEPVSTTSLVLGGLSAGGGLLGKQQAADAQYQAAKNQRQQVINQQRSKLTLDSSRFYNKQADRERADMSAVRAGEEAYLGNQRKYDEKVKGFMVNKQNRLIKSLEASGQIGAKMGPGGSQQMAQTALSAATGRDTATALAGLRSSATQLIADNRGIKDKLQGEYESNYSSIGDRPVEGFTPPEAVKPQGVGIFDVLTAGAGVGLGAMDAASAAKTLPNGQSLKMMGGGNSHSFSNYDSGINFFP